MLHIATIVESSKVDQPLDVGNEFGADEVLLCAMNLLLERAGRAGNQIIRIANVPHLGEDQEHHHQVVHCCNEPVERGGFSELGQILSGQQIIPVCTQPPVLDVACQQRNISLYRP